MFETPTLLFRPNTDDADMWSEVWVADDYKLVEDDVKDKIVLDVGGHVGAFAARCIDLGARLVVSVEPNPDTCDVHRQVMRDSLLSGKEVLLEGAAWIRSGRGSLWSVRGLHGGDSVINRDGFDRSQPCNLIQFKSLLTAFRPQAVKLDIEYAEYDILIPLPDLACVETMWVEFHGVKSNWSSNDRANSICTKILEQGFEKVKTKDADAVVWRFKRKSE